VPTAEVIHRDFNRLPHSGAFRSDQWEGSSSLITGRAHELFCFTGSLLFLPFLLCAGLWSLKVLENEEPAGWDSLRLDSCPSVAPSNGHPWTQQAFLCFEASFPLLFLPSLCSHLLQPITILIFYSPLHSFVLNHWYMHLHLSILFVSLQAIIFYKFEAALCTDKCTSPLLAKSLF